MTLSSGIKYNLWFMCLGSVATVLALACIAMTIASMVVPYWDVYEITDTTGVLYNDFADLNRGRGVFTECFYNVPPTAIENAADPMITSNFCMNTMFSSSNPSTVDVSIMHLRRLHPALLILAMCLALLAVILFIVTAVLWAKQGQLVEMLTSRSLIGRLVSACAALTLVGSFVYLLSFTIYHIMKNLEFDRAGNKNTNLPRTIAYLTNDQLARTNRFYGNMYYLAWGALGCLLVSGILYLLSLFGYCPQCFKEEDHVPLLHRSIQGNQNPECLHNSNYDTYFDTK